jgi:nitrate reductase NapE component
LIRHVNCEVRVCKKIKRRLSHMDKVSSWLSFLELRFLISPLVSSWLSFLELRLLISPLVSSWLSFLELRFLISPLVSSWLSFLELRFLISPLVSSSFSFMQYFRRANSIIHKHAKLNERCKFPLKGKITKRRIN